MEEAVAVDSLGYLALDFVVQTGEAAKPVAHEDPGRSFVAEPLVVAQVEEVGIVAKLELVQVERALGEMVVAVERSLQQLAVLVGIGCFDLGRIVVVEW